MAYLEIERKFLVKGEYKSLAFEVTRIKQGYIASGNGRTVRVRIRGNKGCLTIKGPSDARGLGRFEWEKEISVEEAEALLTVAEPGIISKSRYLVRADDGHVWEVDEFYGENEGLTNGMVPSNIIPGLAIKNRNVENGEFYSESSDGEKIMSNNINSEAD